MKASKFTEAQIAFILKPAEDGVAVARFAARLAFRRHFLHLWTALLLQVGFDLICAAHCKHLSGVTRHIGAPKWGIRSRMPLQLVGL